MTNHLLHLDFETTGLDPFNDTVIEVGAILTDAELNELARYDTLIMPRQFNSDGDRIWSPGEPVAWVPGAREMAERNGLVRDLDAALAADPVAIPDAAGAEEALLSVIDRFAADSTVLLAGSGVAKFDARFISSQMPSLDKRLSYQTGDMSPVRIGYRLAIGSDLTEANTKKTHRAMDDVECHLEEARVFRAYHQLVAGLFGGPEHIAVFAQMAKQALASGKPGAFDRVVSAAQSAVAMSNDRLDELIGRGISAGV